MSRVDAGMVTSGLEIPGYRVVRNFGIVRGIIVRSRSVIGNLGAALQTIVGGNIAILTNLCEKTREDAFELLLQHAAEHGANAVIGMRYDATEVMQGVTEVLAYGTAVRSSAFRSWLRRRIAESKEPMAESLPPMFCAKCGAQVPAYGFYTGLVVSRFFPARRSITRATERTLRSMYAGPLCLRSGRSSELCRQFFDARQRAARCQPRVFHEGRIQQKGATVDKGVVRRFKGFAAAMRGGGTRQQLFIHLQVPLKIERVAGGPTLLPRQRGQGFSTECPGIPTPHWPRF